MLSLSAGVVSCSVERNTWTSKAYHNTTAHYNGYFYANEEVRRIETTIRQSHVDDYNDILRLFPTFDSALAAGYSKEAEEAVKMASLAIQRHSNSKWVDDAYILVGKSRLYTQDWTNAIQTFKHVNSKSKDKDARHYAIINLIRTYLEHQEFNNARSAIDFLAKAKLNAVNTKRYNLEKAYYYQLLGDYDNMVRSLTAADRYLKKSDRRGRIYFIIGQVYQELGFEAEAYNYYKKCLATHPEFEVDFYARLYMAQVTEISRNRDVNAARKTFKKLLKDSKNREFQDKIYYEMGVFELKQKNLGEAITFFNQSIRNGSNKKIDGEAYLRLGEVYYDTLRNYELSQAYYDSAITSLPADYENYTLIKQRAEILNEFVKHLRTIKWQDSLLNLASLDSSALIAMVSDKITKQEQKRKSEQARKKRSNRVDLTSNAPASTFNNSGPSSDAVEWYFGNPSAMAIGQTEFARVWGSIKLEDNWRRSQRQTSRSTETTAAVAETGQEKKEDAEPKIEDLVATEYKKLQAELPRTEEAKKTALSKIEEAYFHLADIYHFKLLEPDNAQATYQELLRRFPSSVFEPEVLYALYLLTRESDPSAADQYATLLKSKYPESKFAKILINPDYLQESSIAVGKQKEIYKAAYSAYQANAYDSARQLLSQAYNYGETPFTATIKLLEVLLIGKTEHIAQYQFALDQFIKTYEQSELSPYAKKLLETSRQYQQAEEKRKGIQYIKSFDEPHYFVVVHLRKDKVDGTKDLETFNANQFQNLNLKTSNLILNDEYAITFVSDLPDRLTATGYLKSFSENQPQMKGFRNHKFHNFVITKDNFDIFYRTKGLDEYIQFFEKNYSAQVNK